MSPSSRRVSGSGGTSGASPPRPSSPTSSSGGGASPPLGEGSRRTASARSRVWPRRSTAASASATALRAVASLSGPGGSESRSDFPACASGAADPRFTVLRGRWAALLGDAPPDFGILARDGKMGCGNAPLLEDLKPDGQLLLLLGIVEAIGRDRLGRFRFVDADLREEVAAGVATDSAWPVNKGEEKVARAYVIVLAAGSRLTSKASSKAATSSSATSALGSWARRIDRLAEPPPGLLRD